MATRLTTAMSSEPDTVAPSMQGTVLRHSKSFTLRLEHRDRDLYNAFTQGLVDSTHWHKVLYDLASLICQCAVPRSPGLGCRSLLILPITMRYPHPCRVEGLAWHSAPQHLRLSNAKNGTTSWGNATFRCNGFSIMGLPLSQL
jgi:hypothetical protein